MGDDKLHYDTCLDKWFFIDEYDFAIGTFDTMDDAVMARDAYYETMPGVP